MGIEWINRTDKTYRRSLARGRSYILTPSLHDPNVRHIERSFQARVSDDHEIAPGKKVLVKAEDGRITLLDTNERVIGQSDHVPDWLVQHVGSCPQGVTLGVIDEFNVLGGTADVSVQQ